MSSNRSNIFLTILIFAFGFVLASCRPPSTTDIPLTFQPTEPATETPFVPTPLPPAPKTLIVCVGPEPESLFIYHPDVLYGDGSAVAHTILQAIYDGPLDLIDYGPQAVILEALPTLENGGVTLQAVTLGENEVYFDPESLQPKNLKVGDRYLPSGCNDPGCLSTYTGGEVQLDQMVVEFTLQEGIRWSDGEALTASDSVYSYNLDRSGEVPTTKYMVDRTSEYRVIDERTTRWIGIPGFMDSDYLTNFWTPLPEHALGSYQVSELLEVESVNRAPLGWGAYAVESWQQGQLSLVPNDDYSAPESGIPAFDRLVFRFLDQAGDGALQQIITDECDIVDETLLSSVDLASAQNLQDEGRALIWSTPDAKLVRMDFNLAPLESSRPAYFQDQRTRLAVAHCIDRSQIQFAATGVSGALPTTYINVDHPTVSEEVQLVSYDPETGMSLLDEIGWVMDEDNPEAPRVAFGVPGVRMATPLSVELITSEAPEVLALAELVKADLEACGIEVAIQGVPAGDLAEPWPEGTIYGSDFDLVIWTWPEWLSPLCEMFASWEKPTSTNPYGINASGYRSEAYDAACKKQFVALPGMTGYQEAALETQRLFNQDLPGIPLYQPLRWVASDPEVCGLALDAIASSTLWNLEMLDSGETCP